jgi:HAD superfamily hydrolase (TIGR01459 family)
VSELASILNRYDAFLIDLWGVIHDGTALYPGVMDTLQHLQRADKPIVFLSNAPRVAAKAIANLERLGIGRGLYRDVVTSGQVAHDWLRDATPFGRNYYYLGPGKDEDIIADLTDYEQTPEPGEADFVLCTGYEYDFQPHEEVLPTLARLLDAQLPMLCTNPDLLVVKQDGTQQLCAGECAEEYARMGGNVTFIGKPHPEVYAVGRALLENHSPLRGDSESALRDPVGVSASNKNTPTAHFARYLPPQGGGMKLLCIGDNPLTDILGAGRAGLDSLLVTGGILSREEGGQPGHGDALAMCAAVGAKPTYVLPGFGMV